VTTPAAPRPDPAAGVFTTLLVRDGVPFAVESHLTRLAASVATVYGVTLDRSATADEVARVARQHPGWLRLRITYRPGAPGQPGQPEITATPLPQRPRGPWHLVVRRVAGGWGEHKWADRRALEVWADPADPAVDPLLVDESDHLLETGRGNVFVVAGAVARTPPLDGRILPGTARAEVLRGLAAVGVPAEEVPLHLAALSSAEEVFVTNATGGVRPVTVCAGVGTWPVGPVTRAAAAELDRAWGIDPATGGPGDA
jgi:para-aminobenzoate synthetase / 4-amino-4-deoxychorismate lyase